MAAWVVVRDDPRRLSKWIECPFCHASFELSHEREEHEWVGYDGYFEDAPLPKPVIRCVCGQEPHLPNLPQQKRDLGLP